MSYEAMTSEILGYDDLDGRDALRGFRSGSETLGLDAARAAGSLATLGFVEIDERSVPETPRVVEPEVSRHLGRLASWTQEDFDRQFDQSITEEQLAATPQMA